MEEVGSLSQWGWTSALQINSTMIYWLARYEAIERKCRKNPRQLAWVVSLAKLMMMVMFSGNVSTLTKKVSTGILIGTLTPPYIHRVIEATFSHHPYLHSTTMLSLCTVYMLTWYEAVELIGPPKSREVFVHSILCSWLLWGLVQFSKATNYT